MPRKRENRRTVCPECGERATVKRGDYKFAESGLKNVILSGIEVIECATCGAIPVIPAINQITRAIALAVALKPARLTGEEVRFLRKFIAKSQAELSRLMRVSKTTISKWENNEDPVGEQSDRLIRVIAVALGGLKNELPGVVAKFPAIDQRAKPGPMRVDVEAGRAEYAAA